MDHSPTQNHGAAGHGGPPRVSNGDPMSSLLDGLPETEQNQLMEMLHVPLLHGGVNESFLLPIFTTDSDASFALACILLALTACVIELLRFAVWNLERRCMSDGSAEDITDCHCKQCAFSILSLNGDRKNYNTVHNVQQVDAPTDIASDTSTKPSSRLIRWMAFVGVSVLQMFIYLGSTMLMLTAMTMNIFFIVSVGVGVTLGKVISLCVKRHLQEAKK